MGEQKKKYQAKQKNANKNKEKRALVTLKALQQLEENKNYHGIGQIFKLFKSNEPIAILEGETLLTWSIKNEKTQLFHQLLESGQDLSVKNQRNETTFTLALKSLNPRILAKILQEGQLSYQEGSSEPKLIDRDKADQYFKDFSEALKTKELVEEKADRCALLLLDNFPDKCVQKKELILNLASKGLLKSLSKAIKLFKNENNIKETSFILSLLSQRGVVHATKSFQTHLKETLVELLINKESKNHSQSEKIKEHLATLLGLTISLAKTQSLNQNSRESLLIRINKTLETSSKPQSKLSKHQAITESYFSDSESDREEALNSQKKSIPLLRQEVPNETQVSGTPLNKDTKMLVWGLPEKKEKASISKNSSNFAKGDPFFDVGMDSVYTKGEESMETKPLKFSNSSSSKSSSVQTLEDEDDSYIKKDYIFV